MKRSFEGFPHANFLVRLFTLIIISFIYRSSLCAELRVAISRETLCRVTASWRAECRCSSAGASPWADAKLLLARFSRTF